jgi:hypothetical protein
MSDERYDKYGAHIDRIRVAFLDADIKVVVHPKVFGVLVTLPDMTSFVFRLESKVKVLPSVRYSKVRPPWWKFWANTSLQNIIGTPQYIEKATSLEALVKEINRIQLEIELREKSV